MTQSAQPEQSAPTTATPTTNGITVVPSIEERAAAAFGELDSPSETAADSADGAPQQPSTSADPAAASGGDTPEKRAADRKARLDALKAQERDRVDSEQRKREQHEWRARAEAAERKAAELEKTGKATFDPSTLTEEQFLDLAQRINVSPQKLGELIRERMLNPEAVAAQAAVRSVDPKLSALEKKLADQQAVIDSFLQQQQASEQRHQEAQAAHEFNTYVSENAAGAPYASAFLRHHGPQEFYKLAHSASASVPPGAGWQAVLDVIEENLSTMAPIYAPQGATAQQRQALPKPHPAAAKATTVSNSLAQERASVVDSDQDWASLPFEERSARLFR